VLVHDALRQACYLLKYGLNNKHEYLATGLPYRHRELIVANVKVSSRVEATDWKLEVCGLLSSFQWVKFRKMRKFAKIAKIF